METVKETLSKEQLEAIEDFSIEKADKILSRIKIWQKSLMIYIL